MIRYCKSFGFEGIHADLPMWQKTNLRNYRMNQTPNQAELLEKLNHLIKLVVKLP